MWALFACLAVLAVLAVAVLWIHRGQDFYRDKKDKRNNKKDNRNNKRGDDKQGKKDDKQGKKDDKKDDEWRTFTLKKGTGAGTRGKAKADVQKVNATEAKVVYDLDTKKLEWGCRGKVGGFFVGSSKASGGKNSKNSASLRLMWDGPSKGAYAYVYAPKGTRNLQPEEFQGKEKKVNLFRDDFINALGGSEPKSVELGMKLNTVKNGRVQNNGTLTMTARNKKGERVTKTVGGIVWRTDESVKISELQTRPFHGGGDEECSTAQRTSTLGVNSKVVVPKKKKK